MIRKIMQKKTILKILRSTIKNFSIIKYLVRMYIIYMQCTHARNLVRLHRCLVMKIKK